MTTGTDAERRAGTSPTTIVVVASVWVVVVAFEVLRLPTFGSLQPLDLLVRGWLWVGAAFVTARLAWRAGWTRGLPVSVLVVAVVVAGFNWSVLAPRAWFATHRALYDLTTDDAGGGGYYGSSLGWLRPLTVSGNASRTETGLFYPQWIGIPDDAGGYLWSPSESPEGLDLYGRICTDPVDLGDGWWLC